MSEVWNTKYGKRRVRHDPPDVTQALAAAAGLSDDPEHQAEIAAQLMGVDVAEVRAEMKKLSTRRAPVTLTSTDRKGFARAVVVERRPSRVAPGARVTRPLVIPPR